MLFIQGATSYSKSYTFFISYQKRCLLLSNLIVEDVSVWWICFRTKPCSF